MLGLTDESIYPSQKVGSTGQSDQPRWLAESNLSIGSTQLGQISQNSLHRNNATNNLNSSKPSKIPSLYFCPVPACGTAPGAGLCATDAAQLIERKSGGGGGVSLFQQSFFYCSF